MITGARNEFSSGFVHELIVRTFNIPLAIPPAQVAVYVLLFVRQDAPSDQVSLL